MGVWGWGASIIPHYSSEGAVRCPAQTLSSCFIPLPSPRIPELGVGKVWTQPGGETRGCQRTHAFEIMYSECHGILHSYSMELCYHMSSQMLVSCMCHPRGVAWPCPNPLLSSWCLRLSLPVSSLLLFFPIPQSSLFN